MNSGRRDFLKQSGYATLAAFTGVFSGRSSFAQTGDNGTQPAPENALPMNDRKIGYCIVGLGRISMGEFMPGVRLSKQSKIVALVSGHRPKAEHVASEYGVSTQAIYSYDNYDSIRNNPEIDAVYIALPNGMHAEYTIRAAHASKHVLCEKPMANSIKECEQMIAASKQANRKLMIVYRCQYEPTNLKAIELLRNGYVGEILAIESSNGFNIHPGEWRLNKKLAGGGPLMDTGIYSLQATRYLTGEEPNEVQAYSSVIDHDGRFKEVEETVVWSLHFPSGVLANCTTTYGSSFIGSKARVIGSKGELKLDPAFGYQGLHLAGQSQGKSPLDIAFDNPAPRQFTTEADYFSGCILNNKEPKTNGEEGLRDERIMTAIYQSCASGKPVRLLSA